MTEAFEIKRPSAACPAPTPSQAFLTTPSPRCYEKVVRNRGPGLGRRSQRSIQSANAGDKGWREEATRHESRGKSLKEERNDPLGSGVLISLSCSRRTALRLFPLTPRLEATSEALRASPVSSTPKALPLATRTPARRDRLRAFDSSHFGRPLGVLRLPGARDWRHPCRPVPTRPKFQPNKGGSTCLKK